MNNTVTIGKYILTTDSTYDVKKIRVFRNKPYSMLITKVKDSSNTFEYVLISLINTTKEKIHQIYILNDKSTIVFDELKHKITIQNVNKGRIKSSESKDSVFSFNINTEYTSFETKYKSIISSKKYTQLNIFLHAFGITSVQSNTGGKKMNSRRQRRHINKNISKYKYNKTRKLHKYIKKSKKNNISGGFKNQRRSIRRNK